METQKAMEDISDVFCLENQTPEGTPKPIKHTDYRKTDKNGIVCRFLFECAIKLEIRPLTTSTAAIMFHRFLREINSVDYDEYLIAVSCLYLAGKVEDDTIKIRDVINIAHSILNREASPLELGDEYWSMRDAIVQAELLIARTLKFDLNIEHPQKFLLYYMKTLQDWIGPSTWNSIPISKTAMSYLQDFHHSSKILDHKCSHIAICCLSLSLQTYGIQIPLTDESDEETMWYSAFVSDLNKDKHWEIIEDIIEVYKHEAEIDH